MANRMHILKGFINLHKIYESHRTLIYRAVKEGDTRPVILKIFQKGHTAPEEIQKFN